ncbi:MAG: osmotically inducible protein OsmC [Betaproteobacteria bacterium HGW-Betaproteobacteria-7]|jgi:putative redox protein|nr:MAG: osmotically inducible protein OsmC [Betaproteobacteria bacterium HGW-Betaproteobacteria-7]
MADGVVVVSESGKGRYQQEVLVGQHRLLADEPASMGGDDSGPAPFDLLLSALGACTAMTVRMYAERKELSLQRVSVTLRHEKIDVDGVRRDHIERRISLAGDLSSSERQRLLEIAEKCPIHRALSQPLLITSSLEPVAARLAGNTD